MLWLGLGSAVWAASEDYPLASPVVAEAVKRLQGGDPTAVERCVAAAPGDVWLLVEELASEGQPAAVRVCLAAAPEPLRKPLEACAAAVARHPTLRDLRARVREAHANDHAKRWAEVLQLLVGPPPKDDAPSAVEWRYLAGSAAAQLKDSARASAFLVDAVAMADRLGWAERARDALLRSGRVAYEAEDLGLAIRRFTDLRMRQVEAGLDEAAALTEIDIATALYGDGQFPECVRRYLAAIPRVKDPKLAWKAAVARSNLGIAREKLGMYAEALEDLEGAQRSFETLLQDERLPAARRQTITRELAHAVSRVGIVRRDLRQYAEAVALHGRAMKMFQDLGGPDGLDGIAQERGNLGTCLREQRDLPAAEEALNSAREFYEAVPDLSSAALCRADLALCRAERGDKAGSAELRRAALDAVDKLGTRGVGLEVLVLCGRAALAAGEAAEALGAYRKALGAVETGTVDRSQRPAIREGLARSHAALGSFEEAFEDSRAGLADLRELAAPLGDGEADGVVEGYAGLFDVGFDAAAHLGHVSEAVSFVESSRAQALLEALGGAYAIREALVPAATRARMADAESAEARAHGAFDLVAAGGDRRAMEPLRSALDAATRKVEVARAEVAREKKRIRAFAGTAFEGVERLRRRLAKDQVFVEYVLGEESCFALVIAPEEKRDELVPLGTAAAISEQCLRCVTSEAPYVVPEAVETLRGLVWSPLRLGDATRTVLVSPDGDLALVPPALLDPARAVCYVPSASALAVLQDVRDRRGRDVLAVGGCSYEKAGDATRARASTYGIKLSSLPGSAAEAAVFAPKPLLGDEATEDRVLAALGAHVGRWDAILFACHGVLNDQSPLLSALALTPGGAEDGFLTVREILGTRFETDLLVLSACETARGRTHRGEGVLSCARACLFAGASRVIASLWDVDDAATAFSMSELHRLWDERKTGAAEALRLAQKATREHVDPKTGKTPWSHPRYWAAWVLWGLPE